MHSGSFLFSIVSGLIGTILGAFGHNWVHQPRYRLRARFSLDLIGLSSDGWFREHNLQHHMYTNTPEDNHFHGTDPFLITDPTIHRTCLQRNITPFLNPIILACGILGNYAYHTLELARGCEKLHISKIFFPLHASLLIYKWSVKGVFLFLTMTSVTSLWYFTLALMNHNTYKCHDISKRKQRPNSWAHLQVQTCTDYCPNAPFIASALFLWLNTHTVHHLFPRVDISHHSELQKIMESVSATLM